MFRKIFWFLPLVLTLIACNANEPEATVPATEVSAGIEAQPTQEPAETVASATAEPPSTLVEPVPAEPTLVLEPATPTAIPTATPDEEPVVAATVEVEALPTVETIVNGQYENTYFRGSETAPVTLIDYSDFL